MNTSRLNALTVALAIGIAGCSSGAPDDKSTTGAGTCASTPYPGNAACIAAPSAAEGFQLHYGPTDPDDPTEVAKYLLQPGQEIVNCYAEKTPNTTDVLSIGYQFHMRPGSHHLIA
ncbi:MAG TPA: hypothetical protein VH142_06345, partial [Polyangiaceae bacterium]|nr:hypothetical protein [Polyangiaceae bacterium]